MGRNMGAIHGKGRFKCDGCKQGFSWRLDLHEHTKICKSQSDKGSCRRKQSEVFLFEVCYLCGQHLIGTHSEEASFVKGKQKLYHSNRPLVEVLGVITCDASQTTQSNPTYALCKSCMISVNQMDELHKQLQNIIFGLRTAYRSYQKRRNKLLPESPMETSTVHGTFCKEEDAGYTINNQVDEDRIPKLAENVNSLADEEIEPKVESQSNTEGPNDRLKKYKCVCGKVSLGIDELVEHQLRKGCKIKTNQYPCTYCDAVFSERKFLIGHKRDCAKKSLVNGTHECDICGRRFLVRGRVETHKRSVHGIGTADQQLCSYCGRTFSSRYNMDYHLAKEHGIGCAKMPVTCTLCGKKFSEKSSYQSHVKTKHLDHRFECEHCGKKYATRGMRNHHINEMHNSSYCYECTLCGEQFKLIFRYRYHMRKMHSSVHHACKDCGKTFVMSSDLYRHIRGVHMGIRERKRYPCKVCGRMFPSIYKVKRHATSHGIVDLKDSKESKDSKIKTSFGVQVKETENVTSLIVQDDSIVAGSLVKSLATTTLMPRKICNLASNLHETGAVIDSGNSGIPSSLSENSVESAHGSTKDVQLPPADVYTAQHLTTLTPEMLQANMNPNAVAAETMSVGPVSGIVVSASAVQECINSEELEPTEPHQLHEQSSISSCHIRRGNTLIQPVLQSSLMPMHQMIVFEEPITEPGHTFSVRPANRVVSVSQCTGQVMNGSQIPSQVICIPHSDAESSTTDHHSQNSFPVPLTQQSQVVGQQKLSTIHYEPYAS
ncbi:zinc finger protein 569-like isoform X3 [Macrobrachium rosenbergii]|uniref:zinc finger protein 569-like isoform X3 n=3 Tax=Macrobrachium rosenbergii TaxID=79674 RepID=UPI0034D3A7B5